MQAVLLTAPGGAEMLQPGELPLPEITHSKQVRVAIHAAGLNPIDYKLRGRGGFYPDRLPTILGCDGAGVVDAVGSEVSRFKVGDPVFFFHGGLGAEEQGNYAEYTLVDEEYLAAKPDKLSMAEAAALPLAWITAWEALRDRVRLQAGESVLIHAGAGGVGHIAIQLAKALGAHVAVTVSNEKKAALAASLGAERCIIYPQEDVVQAALDWTQGRGVDVIMDNVGGDTFAQSFPATAIYGRLVTLLEPPCDAAAIKLAKQRNLTLAYELMLTPTLFGLREARIAQRKMLEEAARLVMENKLKVHIDKTFSLPQASAAQTYLENGKSIGKVVLLMT